MSNDVLSTKTKIAELVGLPEFFDQSTVHRFLNEFNKWHLKQLEDASDKLIHDFGESLRQDVLVLDIDSTTHFNHGESIEFTDHICRIRINQSYPYK